MKVLIMLTGVFFFLGSATAEQTTGPHPALQPQIKQQPSRTLFQEHGGMRENRTYGKEVAIAKLNQMMFKREIQDLTAPDAFRAVKPVAPEKPNVNRRVE